MKLTELKNRLKHKYVIRIVAGVLIVTLVGSSFGAYNVYAAKSNDKEQTESVEEVEESAESVNEEELSEMLSDSINVEEKDIDKDETVYVIADSNGKAESTIVSAWLKNPTGKDTLEDASELKDITNVKGEETFTRNGDKITWQADGNDIYYQGTTTKETPVTEKITYYLNDKEMSAEEIAGKSGKVKIRFDYTNHAKSKSMIGGKEEEVCVPFIVVSGMVLNDSFSNVEVTNGKVVSNGASNMVVGVAMPGLKESLKADEDDFSEDISIPEYVEVTADAKDFSLDMTMSVVTSSSELNVENAFNFDEMDEKVDELEDGLEKLQDGSGELADGLQTLNDKLPEFTNGLNTLQSGVKSYTDGAKTLADGINTLKSSSGELIGGVNQLQSSVNTLNSGVQTLNKSVKTAMSDEEKAQTQAAAKAAVDAQFADDSNPQSYNNIKATAAAQIEANLTSEQTIAGVKQQVAAGINDAEVAAAAQQQLGSSAEFQQAAGQLSQLKDAVGAAAVLQTAMGSKDAAAAEVRANVRAALEGAGINGEQLDGVMAAMENNGLFQAAGLGMAVNNSQGAADAAASQMPDIQGMLLNTAGQVAVSVTHQAANQVSEQVVRGVAASSKDVLGTTVAQAAQTAAQSAAAQAAITGAETAKSTIAGAINAADKESGYSLVSGMSELNKAVGKMSKKMPTLSNGIEQLYNGSQTLVSNNEALNSGIGQLVEGNRSVVEGVDKLASGSKELADGIITFNEEGIEKLVNTYNGDVKELSERIQAIMDAGSDYESFGGKAEETVGNVKFIIKTDAVEKK